MRFTEITFTREMVADAGAQTSAEEAAKMHELAARVAKDLDERLMAGAMIGAPIILKFHCEPRSSLLAPRSHPFLDFNSN